MKWSAELWFVWSLITYEADACMDSWSAHEGKCYRLFPDKQMTQGAAMLACVNSYKATLASVRSKEEEDFFKHLLPTGDDAWLGLYKDISDDCTALECRREGWEWMDGIEYDSDSWHSWSETEPSAATTAAAKSCAGLSGTDKKWKIMDCETAYGFICYKDDWCGENRCQQDGTCVDLENDYKCACPTAFEGKDCEKRVTSCRGTPTFPNAVESKISGTDIGDNITYSCRTGYSLNPTQPENQSEFTIQCTIEAVWSLPQGECQVIDCGEPEAKPYSTLEYENTTYGEVLNQTCNRGYIYTSGNNIAVSFLSSCLSNASWAITPECTIVDCLEPPVVEYTGMFFISTTYNSSAAYMCIPGRSFPNGSSSIKSTCLQNQTWSHVPACAATTTTTVKPIITRVAIRSTSIEPEEEEEEAPAALSQAAPFRANKKPQFLSNELRPLLAFRWLAAPVLVFVGLLLAACYQKRKNPDMTIHQILVGRSTTPPLSDVEEVEEFDEEEEEEEEEDEEDDDDDVDDDEEDEDDDDDNVSDKVLPERKPLRPVASLTTVG